MRRHTIKKKAVKITALVMAVAMLTTEGGITTLAETTTETESSSLAETTRDSNSESETTKGGGTTNTDGDNDKTTNVGKETTGAENETVNAGAESEKETDKNSGTADTTLQGEDDKQSDTTLQGTNDENTDGSSENEESGNKLSDELKAMQDRIDALPTLEEFQALEGDPVEGSALNATQMSYLTDETSEFYTLCDAYFSLSEEERALLDATKLMAIYDYLQNPETIDSNDTSATETVFTYVSCEEVSGVGTLNENIQANLKVTGYDTTATYYYKVINRITCSNHTSSCANTHAAVYATGTFTQAADEEDGTGTVAVTGLKYGDKVAIYKNGKETSNELQNQRFRVLSEKLLNGSFEVISLASGEVYSPKLISGQTVYAWHTTASDGNIEIGQSQIYFGSSVPCDGTYVAELAAYEASSLYQEIKTTPGQTIAWQISHSGRHNVDKMAIIIGPALDLYGDYSKSSATAKDMFQQMASDAGLADASVTAGTTENVIYNGKKYSVYIVSDAHATWGTYSGNYKIPSGQEATVMAFVDLSDADSNGNMLDNIKFAAKTSVASTKVLASENGEENKLQVEISGIDKENDQTIYYAITKKDGTVVTDATVTDQSNQTVTGINGYYARTADMSKLTFTLPISDSACPYTIYRTTAASLTGADKIGGAEVTLLKGENISFYSSANCEEADRIYGLVRDNTDVSDDGTRTFYMKPSTGYAWGSDGAGISAAATDANKGTLSYEVYDSVQGIYKVTYTVPSTGVTTLTANKSSDAISEVSLTLGTGNSAITLSKDGENAATADSPYEKNYDDIALGEASDVTAYPKDEASFALTGFTTTWYQKDADGNWQKMTGKTGTDIKDAGSYKMVISYSNNTQTVLAEKYLTINQKVVAVSGMKGVDKTYDGTKSATLDLSAVSVTGVVSADHILTVKQKDGTKAAFAGANVGKNIDITAELELASSDTSGTGDDAADYVKNYALPNNLTIQADITRAGCGDDAAITITGTAANSDIQKKAASTYTIPFTERQSEDMTLSVTGAAGVKNQSLDSSVFSNGITSSWYEQGADGKKTGTALSGVPSKVGDYILSVTAVSDDGNYEMTEDIAVKIVTVAIAANDLTLHLTGDTNDTGLTYANGSYTIEQADALTMSKATYEAKLEGTEAETLKLASGSPYYEWYATENGNKTGVALSETDLYRVSSAAGGGTAKPRTPGTYVLAISGYTENNNFSFSKEITVVVEKNTVQAPIQGTDFTVTTPTIKNKPDASIGMISSAQTSGKSLEIAIKPEQAGTEASYDTTLTGLTPGETYLLRFKETAYDAASATTEIVIPDSSTMITMHPVSGTGYTITTSAASVAYGVTPTITVTFDNNHGFADSVTQPTIDMTMDNTVTKVNLTKTGYGVYTATLSALKPVSTTTVDLALLAADIKSYEAVADDKVEVDFSQLPGLVQNEDGSYTMTYSGSSPDTSKSQINVGEEGNKTDWNKTGTGSGTGTGSSAEITYEWYLYNKTTKTYEKMESQPTAAGNYQVIVKAHKGDQAIEQEVNIEIKAQDLSESATLDLSGNTALTEETDGSGNTTYAITLDQLNAKDIKPTAAGAKQVDGTTPITNLTYTYTYYNEKGEKLSGKPDSTGNYKLVVEAVTPDGNYTYKKEMPITVSLDASVSMTVDNQSVSSIPEVGLKETNEDVIENLVKSDKLTASTISTYKNTGGIQVKFVIKDISDTTPTEKSEVEESLTGSYNSYRIGQIMDISFQAYNNDTLLSDIAITSLDEPVTVNYKLPESLLNTDNTKTRTYMIVRVHEGQLTFLTANFNASANTLTFESGQFSDYYVIYKDTVKSIIGGVDSSAVNTSTLANVTVLTTTESSDAGINLYTLLSSTSAKKGKNKKSSTGAKTSDAMTSDEEDTDIGLGGNTSGTDENADLQEALDRQSEKAETAKDDQTEIENGTEISENGRQLDENGNPIDTDTASGQSFPWAAVVLVIIVIAAIFFILLWKRRKKES